MSAVNFHHLGQEIKRICYDARPDTAWGSTPSRRVANFSDYVVLGSVPALGEEREHADMLGQGIGVMGGVILQTAKVFRSTSQEAYLATLGDERTVDEIFSALAPASGLMAERVEGMYGFGPEWFDQEPPKQVRHIEHGRGGFFALQEEDRRRLAEHPSTNRCPFERHMGSVALTMAATLADFGVIDELLTRRRPPLD